MAGENQVLDDLELNMEIETITLDDIEIHELESEDGINDFEVKDSEIDSIKVQNVSFDGDDLSLESVNGDDDLDVDDASVATDVDEELTMSINESIDTQETLSILGKTPEPEIIFDDEVMSQEEQDKIDRSDSLVFRDSEALEDAYTFDSEADIVTIEGSVLDDVMFADDGGAITSQKDLSKQNFQLDIEDNVGVSSDSKVEFTSEPTDVVREDNSKEGSSLDLDVQPLEELEVPDLDFDLSVIPDVDEIQDDDEPIALSMDELDKIEVTEEVQDSVPTYDDANVELPPIEEIEAVESAPVDFVEPVFEEEEEPIVIDEPIEMVEEESIAIDEPIEMVEEEIVEIDAIETTSLELEEESIVIDEPIEMVEEESIAIDEPIEMVEEEPIAIDEPIEMVEEEPIVIDEPVELVEEDIVEIDTVETISFELEEEPIAIDEPIELVEEDIVEIDTVETTSVELAESTLPIVDEVEPAAEPAAELAAELAEEHRETIQLMPVVEEVEIESEESLITEDMEIVEVTEEIVSVQLSDDILITEPIGATREEQAEVFEAETLAGINPLEEEEIQISESSFEEIAELEEADEVDGIKDVEFDSINVSEPSMEMPLVDDMGISVEDEVAFEIESDDEMVEASTVDMPVVEIAEETPIFEESIEEEPYELELVGDDEPVEVSTDELNKIGKDLSGESTVSEEIQIEDKFSDVDTEIPLSVPTETISVEEKEQVIDQKVDSLSVETKSEIKMVLKYLDNLLDDLPEDKIKEFSQSEYYDLYIKILDKLGV